MSNEPEEIGHAALLPILNQVEEASTLEGVQSAVDRLRTAIGGHFESEEGVDGLFERIRTAAPHRDLAVRRLEKEHVDFLATADSLTLRLKAMSVDVASFARRIREHENEENELLNESLYTDIGGG